MLSNEGFNDYQNFINNICMADRYYLQLLNEKDTAWIVQAVSHLHGDYMRDTYNYNFIKRRLQWQ